MWRKFINSPFDTENPLDFWFYQNETKMFGEIIVSRIW